MLQHQKLVTDLETTSIFINQSEEITSLKQGNKKKRNPFKETNKVQRWKEEEKILYLRFLRQNQQRITQQKSKSFNLFVKMADFIQSKTPNQCRSHHQKVMKKFETLQNVIQNYIPNKLASKKCYFPKKNAQIQIVEQIPKQNSEQIFTKENEDKQQLSNEIKEWLLIPTWDDNIFDVLA